MPQIVGATARSCARYQIYARTSRWTSLFAGLASADRWRCVYMYVHGMRRQSTGSCDDGAISAAVERDKGGPCACVLVLIVCRCSVGISENRLEGQLEFAMGNVLLHVGQSAATPRAACVLVDFFSSLHPVLKAWCIWHLNVCAMDTLFWHSMAGSSVAHCTFKFAAISADKEGADELGSKLQAQMTCNRQYI